MRIVFMGTPPFATEVLDTLISAGHSISTVYTQPDRRSGRGRHLITPSVKQYAIERNLPVIQPTKLGSSSQDIEHLASFKADVAIVCAYGQILPQQALDIFEYGCVNIHPSLLPSYRGPSPVATAILNGETETGVTIMSLDAGMDTGPIFDQKRVKIQANESCTVLTNRLFKMGADLLLDTLDKHIKGKIQPIKQDDSKATYTHFFSKKDGLINWNLGSKNISLLVRAFNPWPGAYTFLNGKMLKIIDALPVSYPVLNAGIISVEEKIYVGTGEGTLQINNVQLEGKKNTSGEDFARGRADINGLSLG